MSTTWIKNPLALWTGNDRDAGGGLVVNGSEIVELVQAGGQPSLPVTTIFDAGDCVVIPGLINCHHHFYQTLTRAFPNALNQELFEWLKRLYPIWALLDERAVELSTRLAMVELMLSGCSTAVDHHYLFNETLDRTVDIQAEIASDLGMRVVLSRGSMNLGESAGGLPPDMVVQDEDHILAESERLIHKYGGSSRNSMLQLVLAPCSPFSATASLMRSSAKLARKHGVLLHTHLAETHEEDSYCLNKFGLRPVDYLESVGWLDADVWLAHGIHFTPSEIHRLGKSKTAVCHCPSSNMILASGHCKVLDLEAAGCPVGIGVDGSASNDRSNMINELRQAFLLQRLHYGAKNVTHIDALRWGTSGGANLLRREDIGVLEEGRQADIALYNIDDLRFSGHHDPIAALIFCGASKVAHLMIAGQWRVKSGEIPGLDIDKLRYEHHQASQCLMKHM